MPPRVFHYWISDIRKRNNFMVDIFLMVIYRLFSVHVLHLTTVYLKMALVYRFNAHVCSLLSTFYCKCTVNVIRFKSTKTLNRTVKRNVGYAPKELEAKETGIFHKMINLRVQEARKSILVQVNSINSVYECRRYCEKFGTIVNVFQYVTRNQENLLLIEFESKYSVEHVIQNSFHINNSEFTPVNTTMLLYRDRSGFSEKKWLRLDTQIPRITLDFSLNTKIREALKPLNSVDEQIEELHNVSKFSTHNIKLRYYTACQLELCFSKLFPTISVIPFGSSVNGFGQVGCDLDLLCRLDAHNSLRQNDNNDPKKLMLHSKPYSCNDRQEQQQLLFILGHIMQKFIPGIYGVQKILQARVPIIKFVHKYTEMQCDLSNTNMIALYMSELLFIYGELDPRVKPLVCVIRQWAKYNKITNENPGRWISNFSLTLLVLFYLQTKEILPSINKLKDCARTYSGNVTYDTKFIQKMRSAQPKARNQSLSFLLCDFFEYYTTFNFSTNAICIRDGTCKLKLDNSPLYIYNPFEHTLNVSKNVTMTELLHIVTEFRNALNVMVEHNNNVILKLIKLYPLQKKGSSKVESIHERHGNGEPNSKTNTESGEVKSDDDEFYSVKTDMEESTKIEEMIK